LSRRAEGTKGALVAREEGQDVSPEWEEGETGGGVIKEGFNGGTHQLEYVDPFVLAE
jgi:hypothetical protein